MRQPVTVLRQYDTKMKLRLNRKEDGISRIAWYTPTSTSASFTRPARAVTTINGFEEGFYSVYTGGLQYRTVPMDIYFQVLSPERRISLLWDKAAPEDTKYSQFLKEKLLSSLTEDPSQTILQLLYEEYSSIQDRESFEEDLFYLLASTQEQYENLRIGSLNRNGYGFCKLLYHVIPQIIAPSAIDCIIVHKITPARQRIFHKKTVPKSTRDYNLYLVPDTFYEVELWSGSELSVIFQHWHPQEKYLSQLYETEVSREQELSDTHADEFLIPADSGFTEQERSWYLEERAMLKGNPIFSRPEVTETSSRVNYVRIRDLDLAAAARRFFFLGGKDAEFLTEDITNAFALVKATDLVKTINVKFDVSRSIIDNMAVLYIEDRNGNLVSRPVRCYLDDDPASNLSEYREKVRNLEVRTYTQRLLRYLGELFPQHYSVLNEIMLRITDNYNVTMDNVLTYILVQIETQLQDFSDEIVFAILKDWFVNSYYDIGFFPSGSFIWSPYLHRVSAEAQEEGFSPYILCTIYLPLGGKSCTIRYQHSGRSAIDEFCTKSGKYITYAISEDDYRYSGFIYVNTVTAYAKSYLVNMEVR